MSRRETFEMDMQALRTTKAKLVPNIPIATMDERIELRGICEALLAELQEERSAA
mgnify:CR=1 FL=1|tara:strand:- start:3653 stop:3817 length:165 start_codon:yes stop_codon:yes gene_type:complete